MQKQIWDAKKFVSVLLTNWLIACLPLLTYLFTVPLTFLLQEGLGEVQ